MDRISSHRSIRPFFFAIAGAALLCTLLLSTGALADAWDEAPEVPEETTSDTMGDHEEGSYEPGNLEEGSENPDSMLGKSQNPDSLDAKSHNPDDMVVGSENPDGLDGRSYGLQNLKTESPDPGDVPIEMEGQHGWTATTNPELIVARRNLVRAQEQARAAGTRYGDMMRTDYPTGSAREEIIRERDAAMAALEKAKEAVRAIEGNPASTW